MTVYKAKVDKTFIAHRNKIAPHRNAGIRGADCEFVEYHQAKVDPMQTINEKWEWDTTHSILGNIDYKQYSKNGIHVSIAIQEQIKKGNIHVLGIWQWYPNNKYVELQEGMVIQYKILDFVDAKSALASIDKETNRFKYPFD